MLVSNIFNKLLVAYLFMCIVCLLSKWWDMHHTYVSPFIWQSPLVQHRIFTRSLKVIANHTVPQATNDFLLDIHAKVHTLDIAPLRSESPSQKRSGMAHVLKGFHSVTCTPTRSSAVGMSHTCLCLPSHSWYSFLTLTAQTLHAGCSKADSQIHKQTHKQTGAITIHCTA